MAAGKCYMLSFYISGQIQEQVLKAYKKAETDQVYCNGIIKGYFVSFLVDT